LAIFSPPSYFGRDIFINISQLRLTSLYPLQIGCECVFGTYCVIVNHIFHILRPILLKTSADGLPDKVNPLQLLIFNLFQYRSQQALVAFATNQMIDAYLLLLIVMQTRFGQGHALRQQPTAANPYLASPARALQNSSIEGK